MAGGGKQGGERVEGCGRGGGIQPREAIVTAKRHRGGGRRKKGDARPGGRGSAQNMVVSYLVLIVRLDSLGSTSHVVLPWD